MAITETRMGTYAYHGESGVRIEAISGLLHALTRKENEKLRCFAASILTFMGIACQLGNIVVFVLVLLLTGFANVALVPQAERIGKGGDSPGKREEEQSGKKSQSQKEQREIEEDEYREQRLPNTRI